MFGQPSAGSAPRGHPAPSLRPRGVAQPIHDPVRRCRGGGHGALGLPAHRLRAVERGAGRRAGRLPGDAGEPGQGALPLRRPALPAGARGRGAVPRDAAGIHSLPPPAHRDGSAAERQRTLDDHRHRHRIGEDGVLPLPDPRPLPEGGRETGHQGHRHLPDERAGDRPGGTDRRDDPPDSGAAGTGDRGTLHRGGRQGDRRARPGWGRTR